MRIIIVTITGLAVLLLLLWALFGDARATTEPDNETALKMYNRLVDACSLPEDYDVSQTAVARTAATNSLRIVALERAIKKFIVNPENKP